jgi:D-cysteine desulfhydrase
MTLILHRKFPSLKARIPSLSICDKPTPLVRMEKLGEAVGHEDLWVKRDDLTCGLYGGNKARKLDFLLAAAVGKKVRAVATSGAIGSHHVLATCIYAGRLGMDVGAIQFPVVDDPHLALNQERIDCMARWKVPLANPLLVPYGYHAWRKARLAEGFEPGELSLIPPGASSSLGCLGYVNAALEIEAQREALDIPPFDLVFTALGTGGTMCGLDLGFRMAGAPTRVVGVRVADSLVANRWTTEWLAASARMLLQEHLGPLVGRVLARKRELQPEIEPSYLGRGYAFSGPEERRVMELLMEKEGIVLEPVYTAKAMRAFLDRARSREGRMKKMLFTLTCDGGKRIKGIDPVGP